MRYKAQYQAGITLIELMIALALGLVISAAAIMLLLTGQRSQVLQQGAAGLQDDANFGLNYIAKDIRLSNLNTFSADINDRTAGGGIVWTSKANGFKDTTVTPNKIYSNLPEAIVVDNKYLSKGDDVSNVNTEKSDQLVIQYVPQYVTDPDDSTQLFGGFDCEGNRISVTRVASGTQPKKIIVQRYFLRTDDNAGSNEPHDALVLACDAGYYSDAGTVAFNTDKAKGSVYGDAGEIIMKRVDYFHVMFGVQNGVDFRYISPKDYMALTMSPKPRILSVQLGALVRSSSAVGRDSLIKDDQEFQVLDKKVTLKTPKTGSSKYVRQVVSQTIALRNTFGERGQS